MTKKKKKGKEGKEEIMSVADNNFDLSGDELPTCGKS